MPVSTRSRRLGAGLTWICTALIVRMVVAGPVLASDFYTPVVFDTNTASTMHGLLDGGPNAVCAINHPGTYSFHNGNPNEPHLYQKYDLYNNGPDRCVSIALLWKHDNCDFEIGAGLYLGSFNPNDPTQNLLAHTWTESIQGDHISNHYDQYRYSPGYYRDVFQNYTLDSMEVAAVVPAFAHVVVVLDSTYQPGQPQLTCPRPTGSLSMYGTGLREQGPIVSVSDTSDYEFGPAANQGGTLRFGLSLAAQAALPLTVHVKTSDGPGPNSATAGTDYTAVDKDVTFQPGQTFQYVDVPILGDPTLEPDELMTLTLSNPNPPAVQFANTTATGRIQDDDSLLGTCHLQSPGAQFPFGTVGQAYGPVTLTADGEAAGEYGFSFLDPSCLPPGLTLTDPPNGGANATLSGTPTAAGTFTCTVHLVCPTLDSSTETHDDAVTIVIQPETPQALVTLDDVTVTEGNAGFTPAQPLIHLSSPAAKAFNLEVVLDDASAQATDPDYQTLAPGQQIGINAGDTAEPIPLNVVGDTKVEGDEKFIVQLRTPITHEVVDTAIVTILNDDAPAVTVPTLGEWGLAALMLGLAAVAIVRLRRG